MKVGFVGLGNMGQGMANNLLSKGAALVVWSRTRAKVDAMSLAGASVAESPADLSGQCDIVLSCLDSVETTRRVFLGRGGLIENARCGAVLADHGTVDISTSRDCASAASAAGAAFLDAPISGGPLRAADGTLSIMVGGDEGAFATARPCLEMMGSNVRRMGNTGAGTAMKLINQALVAVHSVAAAEAFAMANAVGVDLVEAVE